MSQQVKLPALQILKAAPQHAQTLGSSGLSMLLAVCAQWDSLGCCVAVCWSNSRLAERCGLSRNSVAKVRQRLIDQGWLVYLQDGRNAGHYTPKLPEWHAQTSAVEYSNGATMNAQTSAMECAKTVQMRVTYTPSPNPNPNTDPSQHPRDDEEAHTKESPTTTEAHQVIPPQAGEALFATHDQAQTTGDAPGNLTAAPDSEPNIQDMLFRYGLLIKGPERRPTLELALRRYNATWLLPELDAIAAPMWPDAFLEHLADRAQADIALIEMSKGWE